MDFGVAIFPTDETIPVPELAQATEGLGFESLWFPEHTHIPASRESPWPGGDELPSIYWRTLDLFVVLAAAAAVTRTIRIGSGICLVVERDPIITAKEVASVDWLSDGRMEFGVGAGWNLEEMANHGTDPSSRFELLIDRLEAMRAIWTSDEATYHGRFVDFDAIWSWPKPVQSPHPPVHFGGSGPGAIDRVIAHGDGWMPLARTPDLPARVEEFRQRAAVAGRGHLPVTVYGASPEPDALRRLADAGVDRAVLWLPSADPDTVLQVLQGYAKLVATVDVGPSG